MVPEIFKMLHMTTRFRGKTFFTPKVREMGQKWDFFEFKEKFGH